MKVGDAIIFKTAMSRDEEFTKCTIDYIPDPCAAAEGVQRGVTIKPVVA